MSRPTGIAPTRFVPDQEQKTPNMSGTTKFYHGSIHDATSIRNQGFAPNKGPVYISRDKKAAEDAIGNNRYEIREEIARDVGIIKGEMPTEIWNRLHDEGHLETWEYEYGWDYIGSEQTKVKTPEGIMEVNKWLKKQEQ